MAETRDIVMVQDEALATQKTRNTTSPSKVIISEK
jgi:hypothetical protein